MLIQGVVWRDDGPRIRMRHELDEPSQLVPVAGFRLQYRTDENAGRTCIGHVPFRKGRGDYVDCTDAPVAGSRICDRCAVVEATFAANLHHAHTRGSAELDPAIRAHLDQPNRLYLAGFRDGSIKVGTSTAGRADRRLSEQGAWRAVFIAETANGRAVRELEDAVTEQLGVSQSVSNTRKRRGIIAPIEDEVLVDELASTARRASAQIVDAARLPLTRLEETWRNPLALDPTLDGVVDYPLRIDRGRHDLELLAAVGRLLLARRPGGADVFVLDPAPLYGRWLDRGDFGSDEIAIQDSLF